jgi:sigma-B regulation protein RsbU (phosphoserine phosphatase)
MPIPPAISTVTRRLGRLGVAFVLLLAVYLVLNLLAPSSGFTLLATLAVYAAGTLFALQLVRRNVRRLIWRLRNRLIVAYLFIAFVPIVLIVILVASGAYVVVGQVAVYLVNSELERRTEILNGGAQMLAATEAERRPAVIHDVARYMQSRFPAVELVIRDGGLHHYPETSSAMPPPAQWQDASGLILKDGQLYSWAHAVKEGIEVTVTAALTSDLLGELVPGIGEVFLGSLDVPLKNASRAVSPAGTPGRRRNRVPPAANRLDVEITWFTPLTFPYWENPSRQDQGALVVHTRPSAVLGAIFQRIDISQFWLLFFVVIAALLLLVEAVSLILGVSLTRTITGAVHNLYEGTQRIKGGDFSHRIAVEGNDQLAELGRSFNSMTENLERLIVVEKEQERLKSEIEIAREVQAQLFPREAPLMKTLDLTGVCHPARMVSGDYYDFVRLGDANVALAIGDVAGKGISAALLMAAVQSIMRTQLTAGIAVHAVAAHSGGNGRGATVFSAAQLVSQLNQQVYANTSPEKYATFYFGLYDDETRVLTYTNAGHLPPIVMRDGQAERLEITGTVVGAFASAAYEEKSMELRRGDLFVAYTDGIVEPENEYGEPFGDDRLIDLLARYGERDSKEIIARIMENVEQWTGTSELFDDMTMLVARGL